MPKVDLTTRPPIQRLLQVSAGETGPAGTVAGSLLAWWNATSCGGFELTDLWAVDDAIARDMLATAAFRNTPAFSRRLRSRGPVRAARRPVAAGAGRDERCLT